MRAKRSPPRWAEGIAEVPVRSTPIAGLLERSRALGWGFSRPELLRLKAHFRRLGREPSDVEWAGIAQSWSEHCSYKSSRPILRRWFGGARRSPRVLGTGDAGVVRYAPGRAYALRIESHNHPSAIEPYGGAATGIGGILRDVLAVGARPVALADPLFFGPLDGGSPGPLAKSSRFLFEGVVAGIRDYGNRVGVPTVVGGVYFDPGYAANPLVNVACVGLLTPKGLRPNRADRPGDRLVLAGGLTGRDGIGGVAFASRSITERSDAESRGAVQLGNPIMKEPLIHACLEAFDAGLVRGVKDLGGGGLSSASGELVFAGGRGSRIDLDRVPLREPGLSPWEIWVSESQERMILDVRPRDLDALARIFARYDVPMTEIGEVTERPVERLFYRGAPAAELDLRLRLEPPMAQRRQRRPVPPRAAPSPPIPDADVGRIVEALTLDPANRSREGILRLYDHEVQGRTVVKPLTGRVDSPSHGDAAVLRPEPGSRIGLALAVGTHPWACRVDPFAGGMLTVEEAARNLYAVGARPDAVTDCLNFGSPEDPRVLGAFDACVRGIARATRALGIVVPSGNVSFYNEAPGRVVPPTPVLLGVGVLPDLDRAVTSDLKEAGDAIYLVGASRPELGGSLYERWAGLPTGAVPRPDPPGLRATGERLLEAGRRGWIRAAHDVSDGGLGVALCEMAFGGGLGFDVDLSAPGLGSAGLAAVAEGGSRFVVEVPEAAGARFERLFRGRPVRRLGTSTPSGGRLRAGDRELARSDLAGLYAHWREGPAPGRGT